MAGESWSQECVGKEKVELRREADGSVRLRYHHAASLPDAHPLLVIRRATRSLLAYLEEQGVDVRKFRERQDPTVLTELVTFITTEATTGTQSRPSSRSSSRVSTSSVLSSSELSTTSASTTTQGTCTRESAELERELDIARAAQVDLEALVQQLTTRARVAENEWKVMQRQSQEDLGNIADWRGQVEALQQEREELKAAVLGLTREREQMASEMAMLRPRTPAKPASGIVIDTPERGRLQKALREHQTEMEVLKNKLLDLNAKLVGVKKERDFLNSDVERLAKRLSERSSSVGPEVTSLESRLEDSRMVCRELEATLRRTETKMAMAAEKAHLRIVDLTDKEREAQECVLRVKQLNQGLANTCQSLRVDKKRLERLLKEARDRGLLDQQEKQAAEKVARECGRKAAESWLSQQSLERGLRAQAMELMDKMRDQKAAWLEKREELVERLNRYRDEMKRLKDLLKKSDSEPAPAEVTSAHSAPVLKPPSFLTPATAPLTPPSHSPLRPTTPKSRNMDVMRLKCTEAKLTFQPPPK